jgi:Zn-dependent protease
MRSDAALLASIVGLIALLGFAPAAWLAAHRLPIRAQPPVSVNPGMSTAHTTALRVVPAGLPRGIRIRTALDVRPYATAVLGKRGADALLAVVRSHNPMVESTVAAYPYRYAAVDTILGRVSAANLTDGGTALGAALTWLAANDKVGTFANAAPAAYAVLNRARSGGSCIAQLDLLLLLTGDFATRPDVMRGEQRRAETDCPGDPTPGWLVGQAQIRRGLEEAPEPTYANHIVLDELAQARSTFARLVAAYPNETAAVTGLGDAYLAAGMYLSVSRPFSAREDFLDAFRQYDRAAALGDGRDARVGQARALIGLGRPAEGARIITPIAARDLYPGVALELLIAADEANHAFGAAQTIGERFAHLGSAAYPSGIGLYPQPIGWSFEGSAADSSVPLSLGFDRLAPLQDELSVVPGGAGGSVEDLSFMPEYRPDWGVTGTVSGCPSWSWRRDALLAGHAEQALVGWPSSFTFVRPGLVSSCEVDAGNLKLLAEMQTNAASREPTAKKEELTDKWQNLLRWAGDLRSARRVAAHWVKTSGPDNVIAPRRLGEIDFLLHNYNRAGEEFNITARRLRKAAWNDDLGVAQATLARGAALIAAGRADEGTTLLRPLDDLGTKGYAYNKGNESFAALSYFATEQLADHELATGDLHAATEDYQAALAWAGFELDSAARIRSEVLYNNYALASLGLGEFAKAEMLSRRAVEIDSADPVFLMTAAFAAERAGNVATAIRDNRAALRFDPGAFAAANDLGVELSREGRFSEAASALRHAVGAEPSYALGWFNLGVVESQRGPLHLFSSQGALANAFRLEPRLVDRRRVTTIDAAIYRTKLDLSKPLPPEWSLTQTQKPAPIVAMGLLTIVLLGLGLMRSTGHGGTDLAGRLLDPVSERLDRIAILRRVRHPAWAVAATVIAFVLAMARQEKDFAYLTAYVLGVVVLGCIAMEARLVIARTQRSSLCQQSWTPGIVFGIVTGAVGLPWAPLPVVQTADTSESATRKVHLAAPIMLTSLSLLLFVESVWMNIPLSHSLAVASLIMAASTLLPVGPLDGAKVGRAGLIAATGVIGGALLVGLGLV